MNHKLSPSQPPRTTSPSCDPTTGPIDCPPAGAQRVTYARTRRVGTYTFAPGIDGKDRIAVNLFSDNESQVKPTTTFSIGSSPIAATEGANLVDQPLWPWFVLGLLAICLLEWVIYNRRVFV